MFRRDRVRRRVGAWLMLLMCSVGGFVWIGPNSLGAIDDLTGPTSMFVPVQPCRLVDTRQVGGEPVPAGGEHDVPVGGRCGVADDATAAVVTLTVVGAAGSGFATLFPTGSTRPATSTLNYRTGQVVANTQITRLTDSSVSVFTLASTHVVIDVSGYFVAAPSDGTSAGRLVVVEPHRLVDTRSTTRPSPGSTLRIRPDVPADALAVAVNVTTTATRGAGYFSVFPAGTPRPETSILNIDAPDELAPPRSSCPSRGSGWMCTPRRAIT